MGGAGGAVSLHCGKDVGLGGAALSFLQNHRKGALWGGFGALPRVSCHCPLLPWLQVLFGTPQRLEKKILKKISSCGPKRVHTGFFFLKSFIPFQR